jgi:hypothetical protein
MAQTKASHGTSCLRFGVSSEPEVAWLPRDLPSGGTPPSFQE